MIHALEPSLKLIIMIYTVFSLIEINTIHTTIFTKKRNVNFNLERKKTIFVKMKFGQHCLKIYDQFPKKNIKIG